MNIVIAFIAGIGLILGGASFTKTDDYGGFDLFGAISFPTSLDTLANPTATSKTNSPSHATQHSNANDAVEAIEVKLGIDSSAVTTSHDYKLSGVTGSDKSCSLTGTETLTNKTFTSPLITGLTATTSVFNTSTTINGTTTIASGGSPVSIDLGSDATGDVYYRNASGLFTRLGVGSAGQFLKVAAGLPSWATSQANAPTVTKNATSTASSTMLFVADGTSQYSIMAYGSGLGDAGGGNVNFTLTWNGQTHDSYSIDNDGASAGHAFVLRWDEVPVLATSTITVVNDAGDITDATIVIEQY